MANEPESPRLLRSVGLNVIPPEEGEETLGVLRLDSDRGVQEYVITAESAAAFRTAMDQFLDVGNALAGTGPQAEGRLLSLPVSPASVTIGEANLDGEEVGILQIRSADGREVNLALDEGQASSAG